MGKISALWNALRKGQEVEAAGVVKNGAAAGTAIAGFILALVAVGKAFGLEIPEVTESQALLWGSTIGSVIAFGSAWAHLATSKRVGIGSAPTTDQDARDAGVGS